MESKDRNTKLIIIVVSVILILLVILAIYFIIIKNAKKANNVVEDIYNKKVYVSATLPNIQGNENVILDEFGRKTNISEKLSNVQKFNNLDFEDFKVYSSNNKTSVISYTVINNNNIMVESGRIQLQLKDKDGNVLSIVNIDSIDLLSQAKANVTVDITGDIANVYEVVVDDVNYTMELKEAN